MVNRLTKRQSDYDVYVACLQSSIAKFNVSLNESFGTTCETQRLVLQMEWLKREFEWLNRELKCHFWQIEWTLFEFDLKRCSGPHAI